MNSQKRQPAGQPIGGQFAVTSRAESVVPLTPPSAEGRICEVCLTGVRELSERGWCRSCEKSMTEFETREFSCADCGGEVPRGRLLRKCDDCVRATIRPELLDPNYVGTDIPEFPGAMLAEPHLHGGYDQIDRYPDGALVFRRQRLVHREDGPAVFHSDGRLEYALHGDTLTPPEHDGTLVLASVSDGDRRWEHRSSELKGYVFETHDGYTRYFTADGGVLHREGGPAIVRPDGSGEWWIDGVRVRNPIPDPPDLQTSGTRLEVRTTTTGSRYREDENVAGSANRIKEAMRDARDARVIPGGANAKVTYSTKDRTVRVAVEGLPDHRVYARDEFDTVDGYTPEVQRMVAQLRTIGGAYQRTVAGHHADSTSSNFTLDVVVVPAR